MSVPRSPRADIGITIRKNAVDDGWDGVDFSTGRRQRDAKHRNFKSRSRSRRVDARRKAAEEKSREDTSDSATKRENYNFEVPEFSSMTGFVNGMLEGSTLYLG